MRRAVHGVKKPPCKVDDCCQLYLADIVLESSDPGHGHGAAQDENRHGDFFTAILKARKEFVDSNDWTVGTVPGFADAHPCCPYCWDLRSPPSVSGDTCRRTMAMLPLCSSNVAGSPGCVLRGCVSYCSGGRILRTRCCGPSPLADRGRPTCGTAFQQSPHAGMCAGFACCSHVSRPRLGMQAKAWSRFFCLSVYVTMYLNDHQRSAFYESLGLNTTQFNRCTPS